VEGDILDGPEFALLELEGAFSLARPGEHVADAIGDEIAKGGVLVAAGELLVDVVKDDDRLTHR
jgi:hypothetical protein